MLSESYGTLPRSETRSVIDDDKGMTRSAAVMSDEEARSVGTRGGCAEDGGHVCVVKSFRKHVWGIGVKATPEAIDAVFNEIDEDGGGTLDSQELKDGLKMLIDAAKKNFGDDENLTVDARKMTKAVRSDYKLT